VSDQLDIILDAETSQELELVLHRAALLPDTRVFAEGSAFDPPCRAVSRTRGSTLVASVGGSASLHFAELRDTDLGIAVSGHAPDATVSVDSVADLSSLLDSLVTLRSYAQRSEH
jgi:hypothetical protein